MYYEYEIVIHMKSLPVQAFFVSIGWRTHHWHEELELLLVLEGSAMLKKSDSELCLKEGDVYILNANEVHSLARTGEDNLFLALQVDPRFCQNYHPELSGVRFKNSHIPSSDPLAARIGRAMAEVMKRISGKESANAFFVMARINEIFGMLLQNLPFEQRSEDSDRYEYVGLNRLRRIIKMINEQYMGKIMLQDIAQQEYISKDHLSHFIKDKLGISFQEFVSNVRLEKALTLLKNTDMSVLNVSIACGFSDVKYLNRLVQKRYACSATEYRKRVRQNGEAEYPVAADGKQHFPVDLDSAMALLEVYEDKVAPKKGC